jgi:hypothetical protein
VPDGSLTAVTDPLETPDLVAQLEAVAAQLDSTDQLETMPLTELAEQLTDLHSQLQGALSELDRT